MAGEEDGVAPKACWTTANRLTDPEEAAQFVKRPGVDALAIAIGTSHGAYKFTKSPLATCCASTASRKSTPASPTPTW